MADKKISLDDLEKKFFARTDIIGDYDLNYCIPINVGILSQDFEAGLHGGADITDAVGKFGRRLQKLFGRFSSRNKAKKDCNDSRVQLTVYALTSDTSDITKMALEKLKKEFHASVRAVGTIEEIKEKSWLVLALWDGVAAGETYDSVRKILTDTPKKTEGAYKMTFPKNRPVFQIVLPASRQFVSDQKAEGKIKNYSLREIYPRLLEKPDGENVWFDRYRFPAAEGNAARRRKFLKSAHRMKQFNETIVRYGAKKTRYSENVWDLLPEYREKHIPSLAADVAVLRQICYDVISMKAQLDHRFDSKAVLGFASLGLLFYSMYSDFEAFKPFLFVFLALFSLAYAFYLFGVKYRNNQNYYLEFRALAESMRVQCYWYTAGIDESVGGHYTVKFNKDMSWANYALDRWHEIDTLYSRMDCKEKDDALICKEWLVNQHGYFKGNIADFSRKAAVIRCVNILSKIAWVIAAAALAVSLVKDTPGEKYMIFAIGVINIITLVLSYLSEKMTYKELEAKYTYCAVLAEKAVDDFNRAIASPREIFMRYGEEALAENAEWLMIENDREPDVPNG